MGIMEVLAAPMLTMAEPLRREGHWSIRRECFDYLLIFNERHLRRVLSSYEDYYHRTRTHLSLDTWIVSIASDFSRDGRLRHLASAGRGLHHRYERIAA